MIRIDESLLLRAGRLKSSIPHPSFSYEMAFVSAGGLPEVATIDEIVNQVKIVTRSFQHEIQCTPDVNNLKQRSKIIWSAATRGVPNISKKHLSAVSLSEIKTKNLANVLRLAGLPGNTDEHWGKCYQDLYRHKESLNQGKDVPVTKTRPDPKQSQGVSSSMQRTKTYDQSPISLPLGLSLEISGQDYESQQIPSSIFSSQGSQVSDLTETSRTSLTSTRSSLTSKVSTESRTTASCARNSTASRNTNKSASSSAASTLSSLTFPSSSSASSSAKFNTSSSRRNVKDRQQTRTDEIHVKDAYNTAHMLGTVMLDRIRQKKCKLLKFKSAEDVADFINDGFELELVSGRQLSDALKKGKVGQEPILRGRRPTLDHEDLDNLASLVFTAQTIEQVNGAPNRLMRKDYISRVGKIVNSAREDQGLPQVDDINLYRQIEKINARASSLTSPDKREVLRHTWLTFEQQKKHHQNWENTLVELEFGRLPASEDERKREGNVVLEEGAAANIINYDEMGFQLDGSKDSIGGRPGSYPTNSEFADNGVPTLKSDKRVTIMFGVNMANEAIPPLIVLPSSAKTPKLHLELLQDLHQIEGQWGYKDGKKQKFPCHIAFSEKGGVTKEMFKEWHNNTLSLLYPFASDVAGKRVLSMSDGGPGRRGEDFLAEARVDGFYHYPGLPNGTKYQTMDNLYFYTKTIMYNNQNLLWGKRYDIEGEKAQVNVTDIGKILFGGKVDFHDGTSIYLRNAFETSFSPEAIDSAKRKCGYVPATRAPLLSNALRHELIETPDGEIDHDTADASSILLHNMEVLNHEAVARLERNGYSLAIDLKRSINRVSAATIVSRQNVTTEPGTTERQRLLAKATTSGAFFKVTNGGGPMNCDDCMIALEMKCYEKELADLKKRKSGIEASKKIKRDADAVVFRKGADCRKWNKGELIKMIKWKDPSVTFKDLQTNNVDALKLMWLTKYRSLETRRAKWTDKEERRLNKVEEGLRTGNIGPVDKTGIYKRAIASRQKFLDAKLSELPKDKSLALVAKLLCKHLGSEEEAVNFVEKCFTNDAESISDGSACSSDDELSIEADDLACSSDDESSNEFPSGNLFEEDDESSTGESENDGSNNSIISSTTSYTDVNSTSGTDSDNSDNNKVNDEPVPNSPRLWDGFFLSESEDEEDSDTDHNSTRDVSDMTSELSKLKVTQLRDMCRAEEIKNFGRMRKNELVQALKMKENQNTK